ncbi:MAG TPA: hypothetical protein VF101_00575 [Gaiellaceae bacterium]
MLEPGIDRHEWESEWESLEPALEDDPADTLPEIDRLVARMLKARGYDLDDPVARVGDEREVIAQFLAAREVTETVLRDENRDPGDVADAVNAYRELYDFLLDDAAAAP